MTPVGGYLSYMLGRTRKAKALSYIAPVKLPRNYNDCDRVLKSLYDMKSKSILFGKNKDAYHYVIGELVDNIYEHSEFSFASVMAQKYNRFGAIELCFFDNGITIPGSYKKLGLDYVPARHFKAILKAVEGVSTKPETGRGYGLSSNVQMFRHAGGRILIVSGHGAAFIDRFGIHPYMLRPDHALSGTLISLSVPDRALNLNIYEYLEK